MVLQPRDQPRGPRAISHLIMREGVHPESRDQATGFEKNRTCQATRKHFPSETEFLSNIMKGGVDLYRITETRQRMLISDPDPIMRGLEKRGGAGEVTSVRM